MNETNNLIRTNSNLALCFRKILLTPATAVEHDCRVRHSEGGG